MRPTTKHDIRPATELCRTSAAELGKQIRDKELSSREVTVAFLDRIDEANPLVNAIVSLRDRDPILAEADVADAQVARGADVGALHGLPIAIKDLALTRGLRTTFGSPIFADFVPEVDDIFVERIRRAGAIVIGKTNVPEFGLGSNTYNPVFGPTRNAFDPLRTAGGSSGGAAVALALDLIPLADGSDYGGSLRNPAAYNNVYGFRPTQGLVPGGSPFERFHSQQGTEGPMARTVRDLALLLGVLAGYDPRAPLSHGTPTDYLHDLCASTGARVAWLGDLGGHLPMERGILSLCETALARLDRGVLRVEELVPAFDYPALWEAFVTLRHATSGFALKTHLDAGHEALLKPEALWEIEGALTLSAGDVHEATVRRTAWYRTLLELWARYDVLALPSAQVFPFPVETHWPPEIAGRTMQTYHQWMEVSIYATLAGCPALNVPVGFDEQGRPMGIQLLGRPRGERELLEVALAWEATSPWSVGASASA